MCVLIGIALAIPVVTYGCFHGEIRENKPALNKTYSKTCVTSKDSDQPVHPSSMARVLVYSSLDSPEVEEDTLDQ